jgi:dihydroflavonol-4-reductase
MKILLVGATGQIGYALARTLAAEGRELTVLVRDRDKLPFPAGVRVLDAPAFTAMAFRRALEGIDYAIYGVGLPEQFLFDTSRFQRINLDLLALFLDELSRAGINRLTVISTYEVFEARDGIIRESHPIADERGTTPYFHAMIRAYRYATSFAAARDIRLTTIHPAAVYGGLNTSRSITGYIENLLNGRVLRVPFITPTRFPVVHVDSLAAGIAAALGHPGAFILSDQMTGLREIALRLHAEARTRIPPVMPPGIVRPGATLLEALARLTRRPPIMARVQLDFLTKGWEPRPDRAIAELGWQPTPLEEGLSRYLAERGSIPQVAA